MFEGVIKDSRGVLWDKSDRYQESDAHQPGWLELTSDRGETLAFTDVLDVHGFQDGDMRYLHFYPHLD